MDFHGPKSFYSLLTDIWLACRPDLLRHGDTVSLFATENNLHRLEVFNEFYLVYVSEKVKSDFPRR